MTTTTTYTGTTYDHKTLAIWHDQRDPSNPGLSYAVLGGMDSGPIDDLDDLLSVLRVHQPNDLDDLPTFGGNEPTDTEQVWSWDETRLLVGTCCDDLKIVKR